jgi:hypothetical protein
MTAKAKPRKCPTKAPPVKPAPKGTPREASEIERLCARLKWLDADSAYKAALASTDEEADTLINVHNRELEMITSRLADYQANTLRDAQFLLGYMHTLSRD